MSTRPTKSITEHDARNFLRELDQIRFYQTFEIVPNVFTPSGSPAPASELVNSEAMLNIAGVPQDLTGKTVLDVGAFNGAVGFICERRGADRVLCIDVEPDPRK